MLLGTKTFCVKFFKKERYTKSKKLDENLIILNVNEKDQYL